MTRTETIPRTGVRDLTAIGVLILIGIGIPLWLAAAAGAIGLPSNDDWVYMRAANSLYRTGTVDLVAHTAAFIGQLASVQPFLWLSGGEPWAFTAYGLIMASIGIAATYLLARCFLGVGFSVIATLIVLVMPGFARQSASFMTDGPALALMMMCLLLGTKWLQGGARRATLVASVGVGLFAVSIREFAVAAPISVLAVAWARSRPEERNWLTVLSGALAAGVVGIVTFASIPGNAQPLTVNSHGLGALGAAFITLAAFVLPAAVLAMAARIASFNPKQLIFSAGLVGLMVALARNGPLIGNLWTANGLGGGYVDIGGYYEFGFGDFFLTGSRNPVFDATAWNLSEQLAIFAAILLAALVVRWSQHNLTGVASFSTGRAVATRMARAPEAPLVVFLLVYGAALIAYSSAAPLYDRYLYPMVPAGAILLLRAASQTSALGRSQALTHGALVWLAASAFIIAANSFAYDTARHAEGEVAVAMGYDAGTVDAGYEWVGSHGVGPEKRHSNPLNVNWWEDNWPTFRPCAVLSNSLVDMPGYELVRVNPAAYRQYLFFGPDEPLLLYGAVMDGCPAPPST